jgi:nitroreductase
MTPFMQALNFRHACKTFDADKKIPDEAFQQILEFGRLSPSSFGMEQWRFLVIQPPETREALRQACWGQAQITESSHVIIILAKTAAVKPGTDYVTKMFDRRNLAVDARNAYLEKYASHHQTEIEPHMSTYAWSSKQCYLALANMMTGAASLGIDSCPIEGFSKQQVEALLDIDTKTEEVAVVVTFGYRAGEQTPRLRLKSTEIIEYR